MKLNQSVNLRVEDFPSEKDWISRLFVTLNPVLNAVNQVLDYNIDFATNIRSVTKAYDTSNLTLPIEFSWPFSAFTPVDLRITQAAVDLTEAVLLPAWSYDASTQVISITSLYHATTAGLAEVSVGTRYQFTVRVTV